MNFEHEIAGLEDSFDNQVNLGNNDIKKINISIKVRQKRNEKGRSVTVVVGDSIVKNVKGWELSTKDDLFVVRSFPGAKTDDMESYIKATLKNKPERIIVTPFLYLPLFLGKII